MTLEQFFHAHPRAAVAFSGGTDSAFLLWAAKTYGCDVHAYYMKTAFQPAFELADARRLCRELSIPLKEGVYLQTTGPNYETPAEIHLYRALGASAVGMSTACEAMAARHMGMEVCGISCVTNLAAGLGSGPLSHEEVQETADRVGEQFQGLVQRLLEKMAALA